jgi:hypothetical protein
MCSLRDMPTKPSLKLFYTTTSYTECAIDCDLYELVSCHKFVYEILFCVVYKTLCLTLRHHALGVILCLCLNFFELSTAELFFQSQRSLKNRSSIFLSMKVRIPGTPDTVCFTNLSKLNLPMVVRF